MCRWRCSSCSSPSRCWRPASGCEPRPEPRTYRDPTMTDTSPQRPASSAGPSLFDQLVPHAQVVAYVLIGAGVALAVVPASSAVRSGWDYLPRLGWSASLAILLVLTGVVYLTSRGPGTRVP